MQTREGSQKKAGVAREKTYDSEACHILMLHEWHQKANRRTAHHSLSRKSHLRQKSEGGGDREEREGKSFVQVARGELNICDSETQTPNLTRRQRDNVNTGFQTNTTLFCCVNGTQKTWCMRCMRCMRRRSPCRRCMNPRKVRLLSVPETLAGASEHCRSISDRQTVFLSSTRESASPRQFPWLWHFRTTAPTKRKHRDTKMCTVKTPWAS